MVVFSCSSTKYLIIRAFCLPARLLTIAVISMVLTLGCTSLLFAASPRSQDYAEIANEVQQRIIRDFPFFQDRYGAESQHGEGHIWPDMNDFIAAMDELINLPSGQFLDSLRAVVASLGDGHTSISPAASYGSYPGIRLRYCDIPGYPPGIYVEALTQRRQDEGPGGLMLGDRIIAVTDAHGKQEVEVSESLDDPELQWDQLFSFLQTVISASADHARKQYAADALFSAALRGRPYPGEIGIRVERSGNLLDLIISGGKAEDAFPHIQEPYAKIIRHGGAVYFYIAIPTMAYFDDIDRVDRYINEAIAVQADGIMIDMRGNGGGNSGIGDYLIARFGLIESFRFSIVNGIDGSLVRTIGPVQARGEQYVGPVALLTDHEVYSAANHLASLCSYAAANDLRSNGFILIGDRTGGGSGRPDSIRLTPELALRISQDVLVDPDGRHYERGIEPAVKVAITPNDMAEGKHVRMPTKELFDAHWENDLVILEALKALGGQ